ncbi:uncharacterized protein LOC119784405 isoform X2 [Cyprinodon tularosa]|uniref:uncharacterized protein LOC119784405 isoform X2 n=1 Tax=Cyprinodon tularosa TaxID=77115 RepID=UPI0018E282EC|nr:uncharacterized protein LOC119784405 isoform X2 [Cyprinodon tularosa]
MSTLQGFSSDSDSDTTSLSWLSICKKPKKDGNYSSTGFGFGDLKRNMSDMKPNPGGGNPAADRLDQSKYTESTTGSHQWFGLKEEDLGELNSNNKHQITPENLNQILKQISLQKEKASVERSSESCPNMVRNSLHFEGSAIKQENMQADLNSDLSPQISHQNKMHLTKGKPKEIKPNLSKALPTEQPESSQPSKWKSSKPSSTLCGVQSSHPGPTGSNSRSAAGQDEKPARKQSPVDQNPELQQKETMSKSQKGFKDLTANLASSEPSEGSLSKNMPSPSMIEDYEGATPRVFPHICSLCREKCSHITAWRSHQQTESHRENCRLFPKKYVDWGSKEASFPRKVERHDKRSKEESSSRSRSPRPPRRRSVGQRDESKGSSRSRSRSPGYRRKSSCSGSYTPASYRGLKRVKSRSRSSSSSDSSSQSHSSEDRKDRRRSRSRSPRSYRNTHRSRSKSRSPRCDRPTSSYHRSRSPGRRYLSFRRVMEQRLQRRPYQRDPSPRRSEKWKSSRRSRERRESSETSAPQDEGSSNVEKLAKKVLESSAVQTLSDQIDVESFVKTLAPVFLAEIDKLKSTPGSSSPKDGADGAKTRSAAGSAAKLKSSVPKKPPSTLNEQKKSPEIESEPLDKSVVKKKAEALKKKQKKEKTQLKSPVNKSAAATAPNKKPTATLATCDQTPGEQIEKYLDPEDLCPLEFKDFLSQPDTKELLITNLPKYSDGCYKEEDLVDLLRPFGFKNSSDIFVIPQKQMAFAFMQHKNELKDALQRSHDGIFFKGSKLCFQACRLTSKDHRRPIARSSLGFYKALMQCIDFDVEDNEESIIQIQHISPSESSDLRKALRNISSVRNFLPLLNKVYVEFHSDRDADRLGVWYSFLKPGRKHRVKRLKIPRGLTVALSPRLPSQALPDVADAVPGARIPTANCGVPSGTVPPFWVTMPSPPYIFPTVAPWFNIPDFMTVKEIDDIEKARPQASKFSTIMLTGFCVSVWKRIQVDELVGRYFSPKDPESLVSNVVVLPLQRRAFVYFSSWDSCCAFVQEHLKHPVSVEGSPLSVHFVLEDTHPGDTEETMYQTLMRWSNSHVSEPESLMQRLICVNQSEVSVGLVTGLLKEVASVAPFVNYLVLADRIYIEMCESSGAAQLLSSKSSLSERTGCGKVQGIRLLKNQDQSSEDFEVISSEVAMEAAVEDAAAGTVETSDGHRPADGVQSGCSETSWLGPDSLKTKDETCEEQQRGAGASVTEREEFKGKDQTEGENDHTNPEFPHETSPEAERGNIEEGERGNKEIDSADDQPVKMAKDLEGGDKEEEEVTFQKDHGATRRSSTRIKKSKTKEEEKSTKKTRTMHKKYQEQGNGDQMTTGEEDEAPAGSAVKGTCGAKAEREPDQEQGAERSGPAEKRTKSQTNTKKQSKGETGEEEERGSELPVVLKEDEEIRADTLTTVTSRDGNTSVLDQNPNIAAAGEMEKMEEKEDKVTQTRKRGRPRKKTRKSPVRKSAGGETKRTELNREEEEELRPPTPQSPAHSGGVQPEEEMETGTEAASAEQQLQPEGSDSQNLDGGSKEDGQTTADLKDQTPNAEEEKMEENESKRKRTRKRGRTRRKTRNTTGSRAHKQLHK